MRKILNIYNKLEENFLFFTFALSVVLIFIQIIMRYVFLASLSWSEELARYLFIWYTWIGASYAVAKHRHIRIEILCDLIKGKPRIMLELVVLLVWAAFSMFLAVKGVEVVRIIAVRGQLSAALQIPMALAYAAIPAGALLMSLRLIGEIVSVCKQFSAEEVKG